MIANDDEFEQTCALLLLLLQQFFNLLLGEQAILNEGVRDSFAK